MMEVGDENTWFTECLRLFVIQQYKDKAIFANHPIYKYL